MNKILKLSFENARVNDGIDDEFFFSINNNRRKGLRGPTRDWVCSMSFEQLNMKDWVYLHCFWKIEAVRACSNSFENSVWSDSFVVEFLGWARGAKVASIEPNLVANLKVRLRYGLGIKGSCMSFERFLDIISHFGVEILKCLDTIGERSAVLGHPRQGNSELWVIAKVGEEWSDLSGRVNCIVVSKLGDGKQGAPVRLLVIDVAAEVLF